MKSLFTLLLLTGILYSAQAKTYYFSASGSDSYSATQAQSSSTPWKTISKLNAIFSTLQPGDKVLFKRGDTFYGSIIITKSGTTSAPITIGAYGSGAKPVITGFITASNWTSLGGGKYQIYNSSLGANVNVVAVNGAPRAMGRYPNSNATNKGYLYFESVGTNSITDNNLSSSPNWTGAELVIRTRHWILDRTKITGQSGGKLTYSPATTATPWVNYGYFIQNDLRTLDQTGEWYYKPSTHNFYMYFGSGPSGYKVQVSAVNNLINLNNYDNLVFDNLALQGANEKAVNIYSADNIHVQNCDISSSGLYGVWAQNTNALVIENCNITNSNNIGVFLYSNTNGSTIRNNKIKNSGTFPGMGLNGDNQNEGIRVNGDHNLVQYNRVDSSGYCGIRFTGSYVTIKNNYITNFNFVKDDGAGIYTSNSSSTSVYSRNVIGNIVLNGLGAKEGTPNQSFQTSSGIYIDDYSMNVTVSGNSIANCGKVGLFIHDCYNITVRDNTCYDNDQAQTQLCYGSQNTPALRNIVFKNNILVSKTVKQWVAMFDTRDNDISKFGTIDSNYYERPIYDYSTIEARTYLYTSSQVTKKYALAYWKGAYTVYDKASKRSPQTFDSSLNPDNYIRFIYNASQASQTVTLNATYKDAKGKSYSSSVTLAPYTSLVLIKTSGTIAQIQNVAPITSSITTAGAVAEEESSVAVAKDSSITVQQPLNFNLYPNPATDKIFVALAGGVLNDGKAMLVLRNMMGGIVQQRAINASDSRIELDLSALSSGAYIVQITNGSTATTRKFIKTN